MIQFNFFSLGTAFVILQLLPGVVGWGKEGHYAVCKIAEGLLTEDAAAAVKNLLPEIAKGELAAVCSWPDEIRGLYRWSAELHFIDTPDFLCNYEYCRDCHDSGGNKDRCVVGGINNYTMQLHKFQGSASEWKYNLTEALMFLSHFIGDIHQPLHAGFLGDLGGNTIPIHWFGMRTNLHRVWDNMIIETAMKNFYSSDLAIMIEAVNKKITDTWSEDISSWENCTSINTVCPDPFASESIDLACKYAYPGATPNSTLSDEYFLSRLPIVEKRLAQGGVRLASTLNRIFKTEMLISEA
ncbi:hypothetical protein MKW94_000607 [Papaver nudicaule]|uniref:Aspergillus nuclease S1 n=1 Tax=Papaver nudicaule TaxID=74823 RepID=A0AA41V999_PAPNU|nr:hypothetical protein [Papaver nudicaule]